jgi:acid phosphatase
MKQTRRQFVRTLFVASQALAVSRFLPGSAFAATPEMATDDGVNFLVFGDWGRNGQSDQVAVAAQMAAAAKKTAARFVVSVGDNFYEDGVASVTDPQWQSSFENIYHDAALQIPWHVALGNHDYHGSVAAQIAYGKTSSRWSLPARYYVQTRRLDADTTADFFYLDTTPLVRVSHGDKKAVEQAFKEDAPQQLAWFKNMLAASKAKWKIVVGHHPIYSGGEHGDSPELIEAILPLLEKYQVRAYFNGHDHDLQHLTAGSVNLFCSGAGSQVRPSTQGPHSKFALGSPGFTSVTLQAEKMHIRMIDSHGTLVYSATVPRLVPV